MYIESISLRNFRNFRAAKFQFLDGINTVIGENASGKTNLFQAIRILLDDSLPRNYRFYESDFNRKVENWKGHWIILNVIFADLNTEEEVQAIAIMSTGQITSDTRGSFSVIFRPKHEIRKNLYNYSLKSDKNPDGLKEILKNITIEDYESISLGKGTIEISSDIDYLKYVGDFTNIVFPNPDDLLEDIYGTRINRDLNVQNEISCTYIKALRDVESDLKSYTNNPLLNLLKGLEKTVAKTEIDEIVDKIVDLNEQIGTLKEIKDVKNGIVKSITEAVGTTYAPNLEIKAELPSEIERLFQSLKLWVGDSGNEEYIGRIWELSLGGANLIYLSIKLFEFERLRKDRIANLLLVEEPEAHIHTHIQKTLFSNLSGKKAQVIVSTHSTHISSVSQVSRMNIVSRGNKENYVFQPSNNLEEEEIIKIERYLDAVRSNLLFAKGVILVEGDAEQITIPEMTKKVFGVSLDELGVSLVNIGSTGFKNLGQLFHVDRIRKNCAILTDGDKSIIKLPIDPSQDDERQRHFRASEKNGEERRKILNDFCKGNEYLHPFYAKHTFEVDFLMNGNSHEVKCCIDKIYKQKSKIDEMIEAVNNEKVSIAGTAILQMVDMYGKGWFSLLLSNELCVYTNIPEYILEAIAFSAEHIDQGSIIKSIHYRVNEISRYDKEDKNYREFSLDYKKPQKLIDAFKSSFPKDQLSILLGMI